MPIFSSSEKSLVPSARLTTTLFLRPSRRSLEPFGEFPVWRYRQGHVEQAPDRVVVEEPLEIRLGGEPFQVLMRLPGLEKELALGFLFTEGIVRDLAEVITIHFCGTATDPSPPP